MLPFGLLILNGVEEGAVIRCPDDGADPLRLVGQHFACSQIFNVQGVLAESRGVGRIGQQVAVIGDGDGAQRHETFAGRQLVHVEHDLFGCIERTVLAAVDGILRALLGARVIEIILVPERHRHIGLFDVAEHFGVELGLQLFRGLHDGAGVGILLFQKCDHFGAGLSREATRSRRSTGVRGGW